MTTRGPKPKPRILRVITGNAGHRPLPPPERPFDTAVDNVLEPPARLKKRERELWDKFIRKCAWLMPLDAPKAFMWVKLHAEFERSPGQMLVGRISQLRSLGAELGLDPASRTRLSAEAPETEDKAAKYLR